MALVMSGTGTETLRGNNTYTGGTTVRSGTLTLDYSTAVASKLANTGVLTLAGGTLNLAGGGSSHTEVVGSTTIDVGASSVTRTSGNSVLRQNVITRNVGGTVNYGAASIAQADNALVNGIIGGWATVGGTDWATSGGVNDSPIVALAVGSYTTGGGTAPSSWAAANNVTLASSPSASVSADKSINSLRMTAASTVTIDSTRTLTLSSGGLLVTGSGATAITGGTLKGASGTDLVVIQNSSATTTISSVIADNGAATGLTKSGTGALLLTGANTYTGATTINTGTVTAAATSGSALGSTGSILVNAGGTLLLGASNQINDSATMTLAGGTFTKGSGFSEGSATSVGLGALTLTASGSHIDFGTGAVGVLSFASLNASAFTLTIDNWTGLANTVGDATTDRLIFDSDQSSNLGDFQFTGFGPGAMEIALGGGFFEITAIPEPSTWIAGMLAFAMLLYTQRRRRMSRFTRRRR